MLERPNRGNDLHSHRYEDYEITDSMQVFQCRVPECDHKDTIRFIAGRWRHN